MKLLWKAARNSAITSLPAFVPTAVKMFSISVANSSKGSYRTSSGLRVSFLNQSVLRRTTPSHSADECQVVPPLPMLVVLKHTAHANRLEQLVSAALGVECLLLSSQWRQRRQRSTCEGCGCACCRLRLPCSGGEDRGWLQRSCSSLAARVAENGESATARSGSALNTNVTIILVRLGSQIYSSAGFRGSSMICSCWRSRATRC